MELTVEQKRRLLTRAEDLANELASGDVTRSEWRHVLDGLYLAPGHPDQRRASTQELVEALPESGIGGRSKKTGGQLTHVGKIFCEVLRENHPEAELRFLLGWTTRLLDTYDKERKLGIRVAPPRAKKEEPKPAPVPQGPQKEIWHGATVSYDAGGGGIVRAVATDRRTAEARQAKARTVVEAMEKDARQKLVKRRKPVITDVEVEKVGASWHILAVRAASRP